MKKSSFLFALIFILFSQGCSTTKDQTTEATETQPLVTASAHSIEIDLDGMIALYPYIVKARFLDGEIQEYQFTGNFSVSEVVKGEVSESTIETRELIFGGGEIDKFYHYVPGQEYLLFMSRIRSVYTENDYFIPDTFLILVDKEGGVKGAEESEHLEELKELEASKALEELGSYDNLCAYIQEVLSKLPAEENHTEEFDGKDYIHSTDIKEILDRSPYVAEVSIGEFSSRAVDRDGYFCKVITSLKGELEGTIDVIFPKDAVKSEERYFIMLDKPDDGSVFYVLSSKDSVHSADSEEAAIIGEYFAN